MGADLLLTALVHDEGKKLDWAAGRRHAQRLPVDELMRGIEDYYGDTPETVTEARKELNGIVSDLKKELTGNDARDAHKWKVRGAIIHIRGGESWGDDPSEGFTAFTNAYYFPTVLRAIGFEVD